MTTAYLKAFMAESLKIEGINREPTELELQATTQFLEAKKLTIEDIERLVSIYEPRAVLRKNVGVNVRVGSHVPIAGGPKLLSS